MELFLIYLWLKLDALQALFGCLAFFVGLALFVVVLWHFLEEGPLRHSKKLLSVFVVCLLVSVALPSSNQVAVLVGVNYAMKLADGAEGQKIMTLIRKKANQLLDEQLAEKETKE